MKTKKITFENKTTGSKKELNLNTAEKYLNYNFSNNNGKSILEKMIHFGEVINTYYFTIYAK